MTMLLMNGFEQYTNQADIASDSRQVLVDGTMEISTITGVKYGDQALHFIPNGSGSDVILNFDVDNTSDKMFAGMNIRHSQMIEPVYYFRLKDAEDKMLLQCLTNSNALVIQNGQGTPLFNNAGFTNNNDWHIEFEIRFHSSLGYFKVWRNGTLVANETNKNTSNDTSLTHSPIRNQWRCKNLDAWIDNAYFCNDQGTTNNSRLGEVAILDIVPTSDNAVEFTPSIGIDNYATVDQIDGASTDHNEGSNTGESDLYGYSDLPATGDPVLAVQSMARVVNESAPVKDIKLVVNTGANINKSSAIGSDSTTLKYGEVIGYQDGSSTPWTESSVNAIIGGIEVI